MPNGTITSTENTFGTVNGALSGTVAGTLTGSVGVPGPQGSQGPAGPVGPPGPPGVGGTWGSITGTLSSQTDLQTVLDGKYSTTNPSGFITSSALAPYLTSSTASATYQTLAGMSAYLTTSAAAAGYYPLSGNPSGFLTSASLAGYATQTFVTSQGYITASALTPYLTSANAALTYAPIAAGQPTSGTVGQVLTKNSGTNYDSSWQTLIPGDRYLTTSTTSLTINNANKTLTVGTGLSYSSQQDIVITYDAANHMHARVLTYNSGTGVMDVDVLSHSGSGTYAAWTVNVGGAPALASVVWGDITGTLGNQTDLANALNAKLELSGGVLTVNSTIEASTATQLAVFGGSGLNVELTANPSENAGLQYNGLQVQNFSGTMAVTASGLTFPNSSTQTVAYPGSSGFLLKADNLSGLASTSTARTNLGLGTMATATAADYSTTTAANGLYYPLSSNPSSYLVAADIAGKANSADAALTGNVTITTNSANPALVITQDGTGDVVQFKDVTSDTTYSFINAVGKVTTIPTVTASAGFNIPHGTAPTTFVDGDIWTTTGGLFARINGSTNQIMDLTTTQTVAGSKTFSNANLIIGNSTAAGTIAIGNGATVSGSTKTVNILTNGAAGSTSSMLIGPTGATSSIEIGPSTVGSTLSLAVGATASGSTKTVNIGTAGQTGSTTNIAIGSAAGGTSTTTLNGTTNFVGPITGAINNITLGNGTAASTYNLFTGATVSGSTKTVAIGTGGLTGSTTNISIGSAAGGTSTTTLNGTTNGVTAAADTNSVALATTAYVVGQAGSATPLVNGTAAVGTSLRYSRQDHVHPTDTTRAPLASPSFTGTPSLPTGTTAVTQTAGNNTTAVATTAFVTAAVPAFAATTNVIFNPSSTTLGLNPSLIPQFLANSNYRNFSSLTCSFITGSAGVTQFGSARELYTTSTTASGRANWTSTFYGSSFMGLSSKSDSNVIDWSKRIWVFGTAILGRGSYLGNASTTTRINLGGRGVSASGDITSRGIGLFKVGGTSTFINLTVHNGTTLTNVASSVTLASDATVHYVIYSDGAGNVQLYLDGTLAASTTAGPTGNGTSGHNIYEEQIESLTNAGVFASMHVAGAGIYMSR